MKTCAGRAVEVLQLVLLEGVAMEEIRSQLPQPLSPKRLSFAKGTKTENAKEFVEGMIVDEVFFVAAADRLGDFGASRRVRNDLSLSWDVKVREDPIFLRQLSAELKVYVVGAWKLACQNRESFHVVLQLHDTPYIPQVKVNPFSLQSMRKAHYRVVQPQWIGTESI